MTQKHQPLVDDLIDFMERQLFSYLPEWIVREVKLRGLAEHLARNLLMVYQVSEKNQGGYNEAPHLRRP